MFAFISAWESSPVTQLLEKNQLPGLSKSRMIGPEEKGKVCSVALADNKEGACTILYEWTQGIDDKELESLTRQSVPRVDEGLRQAVRRFREVVPCQRKQSRFSGGPPGTGMHSLCIDMFQCIELAIWSSNFSEGPMCIEYRRM